MDDLVAFVRARLAEERALAEAATPGPWTVEDRIGLANVSPVASDREGDGCMLTEDAAHIARQDPAATLARCDALTALVDWATVSIGGQDYGDPAAGTETAMAEGCFRHVAAIWRDHPDYQPEWPRQ